MTEMILVGSKPVSANISSIIDSFQNVARFNFAYPGCNNSGTKATHQGLNPHVQRITKNPLVLPTRSPLNMICT